MEEKVIQAVRQRTILYDPSDRNYLNVRAKNVHWDEVAREVELANGTTAKLMWEKLRHSFRDALRRQQKMMRSGVAPEHLKIWKHQREMGFLLPFMNCRKRDESWQDDSDTDTNFANYGIDDGPTEIEVEDLMVGSEYIDHSTLSSMDNSSAQIPTASTTKSSLKKKKNLIAKTRMKKKDVTSLLKQNMEVHEPPITARKVEERKLMFENTKVPKDPLYHFFISMYETTIKMPPAAQHTVRNQIFNAVTSMEATLLDFTGLQQN